MKQQFLSGACYSLGREQKHNPNHTTQLKLKPLFRWSASYLLTFPLVKVCQGQTQSQLCGDIHLMIDRMSSPIIDREKQLEIMIPSTTWRGKR